MIGSDLGYIFYWWLFLFCFGLIFFPLASRLFSNFFDQGYALSKILGWLIISYFIWLLGSLKILPFTLQTIWLVVILTTIGNFLLSKRFKPAVRNNLKKNWKIYFLEELTFLITLAAWSIIRGFQPDIQGLEKFMDFGFVNSILRSTWFPPADMWLAGHSINYYYFGHLAAAVIVKISAINSGIAYNLLIATLFAFVFSSSFCFGANLLFLNRKVSLKRIFILGLLTACLVSLGGNLHLFTQWITGHQLNTYWYPDATRFIVEKFGATDNTIHEFPIYSFVVADLHGHLLNLPGVILFLSLVLAVFVRKKIKVFEMIFFAWLLAIFYMANTWDYAIYNLVLGLSALFLTKSMIKAGLSILPIVIGGLIFSLPFHLNFKNISGGVSLTDFHSPPWMLLVLWGFPLIISVLFLVNLRQKKLEGNRSDLFILSIIIVAWFLIIFPEFFYLKDIYIHSYQRANTMFKLTYQSFVMFGLISPFIMLRLKKFFLLPLIFFLIFIFTYPYLAIRSYYGLKAYRGLYGLTYLQNSYPSDYEGILWLQKNMEGQPIIAEAVGESYTDFARVSANTGLPTILGWRVHEWLWRGSFDEPGKRTEEVKKIYESPDLIETKNLLQKYQVSFIFLGELERKQYPSLNEKKLTKLGNLVFASGETKIFKID